MDNSQELAEVFANHFIKGGSCTTIIEARRLASSALGRSIEPGTIDSFTTPYTTNTTSPATFP